MNRLKKVVGGREEVLADYDYDGAGQIKSFRYGNGVQTKYSYRDDGELSSLVTVTDQGQVLLNFDYAYDGNGNCIRKSGEQYQNEYAYDRMNRLVSAVQDGQEEKYAYDPVGNRLKKESVQGIETYHYNAKNQLTHIQSGADTLRYLYDKQGNLLEEQGEANRKQYSYDTANRQVSVASAKADGATRKLFQTNRYDGEGLRYETEENGKIIRFLFDCGELAQEKKEDEDIDYAHYGVEADGTWVSGPDVPHVGWQYGTKGKVVGHIILDFVPIGRDSSYSDLLEEIFKKMRLTWPKNFYIKMVDYLKKALIYGHTSRISN